MKIKYTGDQDEITVRHVTFSKGKAVDLCAEDRADAMLAEKVLALPDFTEVKAPAKKAPADGNQS